MKEEKTVLVLTDDMTDKLPESVQESVVWLSEQLRPKELVPFNPVVKALLDLKEMATIKYDSKNEKESVQKYKDAKKAVGSFNSALRQAKSDMKGPYDEIGKKIIVMEKGFKKESDEVMETLQKTFKPYLDAEAKKKAEREAKKEAERNAELNRLKEEKAQTENLAKRQSVFNTAKYDIMANLKNTLISQLNSLNLGSVLKFKETYEKAKFENTVSYDQRIREDFALLSDEQVSELKGDWDAMIKNVLETYGERAEELKRAEEERLKSEREKGNLEGTQIVPADQPEQPPVHEQPKSFERVEPAKESNEPLNMTGAPWTPESRIQSLVKFMSTLKNHANFHQEQMVSQSPQHELLAKQISDMMGKAIEFVNSKL